MQASRQAQAGRPAQVLRSLGGALDPEAAGTRAWRAFMRAHASLMRQLEQELQAETGLAVADFDVLIQLALAGGRLRMTDLAGRALVSRSGMTRRVARLVEDGLVERRPHEEDGRGIVVELTALGRRALKRALPVHARGIARHFASRLDKRELGRLEEALHKVTIDCTFG
jgi:DNA-binding MarR family transcriptional regulator